MGPWWSHAADKCARPRAPGRKWRFLPGRLVLAGALLALVWLGGALEAKKGKGKGGNMVIMMGGGYGGGGGAGYGGGAGGYSMPMAYPMPMYSMPCMSGYGGAGGYARRRR